MTIRPDLYRQYKANEFDPSWLPYLMNYYRSFSLPTEMVISEAQFCVPQQGRIYTTDLYAVSSIPKRIFLTTSDRLYDAARKSGRAATIREERHSFGISDLGEEVFMVEYYENNADDGHTDMKLMGYVFVPTSGLKIVEHFKGCKEFAYIRKMWNQENAAKNEEIEMPFSGV